MRDLICVAVEGTTFRCGYKKGYPRLEYPAKLAGKSAAKSVATYKSSLSHAAPESALHGSRNMPVPTLLFV